MRTLRIPAEASIFAAAWAPVIPERARTCEYFSKVDLVSIDAIPAMISPGIIKSR